MIKIDGGRIEMMKLDGGGCLDIFTMVVQNVVRGEKKGKVSLGKCFIFSKSSWVWPGFVGINKPYVL
jgi:hypothetical protein